MATPDKLLDDSRQVFAGPADGGERVPPDTLLSVDERRAEVVKQLYS
jgi:hypothetical protein